MIEPQSSKDNCKNCEKIPFYSFLSPSDQFQYQELRQRLSSYDQRYNRNKRIETFQENLNEIKKYCVRSNEDDWKRFLVCGICWIEDGICTNTRQLMIVLGKSKSSINGALQKMGLDTIPPKGNDAAPLINAIPYLKDNFAEERQWSIRKSNLYPKAPVLNSDNNRSDKETDDNNNSHTDSNLNSILTRTPCAFGCTCGCDCKINGEATHPCHCVYPDDSYDCGKGVCHCEKVVGMGQIQPILLDESIEAKT